MGDCKNKSLLMKTWPLALRDKKLFYFPWQKSMEDRESPTVAGNISVLVPKLGTLQFQQIRRGRHLKRRLNASLWDSLM